MHAPKPEGTFWALARPTAVPELRRLIDGGGDSGGRKGLPLRGLTGDGAGEWCSPTPIVDGGDDPAAAILRSKSRASLRCCVVRSRSVC